MRILRLVACACCGTFLWCNPLPTDNGDAGQDANSPSDGSQTDTGGDVIGPNDTGTDAVTEAGIPTTYNDVTDQSKWESFDVIAWSGVSSFSSAAWDGKYVYFIPSTSGVLVRYDTTGAFGSSSSWSKFDMSTASSNLSAGFSGSAVDQQGILYLMPYQGVAGRYDTTASFTATTSYNAFAVSSTFDSGITLFAGVAFDGHYIYPATEYNGFYATRYDTTASFASANSWSQEVVQASNFTKGGIGAVFDGTYVYYGAGGDAFFWRYDTTQSFTNTGTAWTTYAPNGLGNTRYGGGCFDGRYVYWAPADPLSQFLPAVRFDTTKNFGDAASWSSYPLYPSSSGNYTWSGAIFDGRYVFFIPFGSPNTGPVIERFDTKSPAFDDAGLPGFDSEALVLVGGKYSSTFFGGAYDGQYVYLVPQQGPALRFKSKSAASMPSSYHGSFR
jgi:hypothetical protein